MFLLNKAEAAREGEAHASTVIGRINHCTALLVDGGIYTLIYQLAKIKQVQRRAFETAEQMKKDAGDLVQLVANDNEEARQAVNRFNEAYEGARQWILHPFEIPQSAKDSLSVSGFSPVKEEEDADSETQSKTRAAYKNMVLQHQLNSRVTVMANAAIDTQFPISSALNKEYNQIRDVMDNLLKVAIFMSLSISLGMAISFNRSLTRRIDTLIANTLLFASDKPLGKEVSGDDEIALLDRNFRQSAQNLEEIRHRERAVVENAANVICSVGADGRIQTINSAVERIWSYTPEECIGARLARFVVKEDAEALANQLAETARTGEGSIESRIKTKDGKILDILWTIRRDSLERTLTCIAHDVTERKHLERMKREFSEVMRTGLQKPLESMKAALEHIVEQRSNLPEKLVNKADSSQKELFRLLKLLDEFVKLDDLSTFGKAANFTEITALQAIEQAVQSLNDWAEKRKVKLKVGEADGRLIADEIQLVRVLINLISNAVKFSKSDTEVVVSAHEQDGFVEFQVIDCGPGIPMESQFAVFEKFKMLDQAQETAKEGSGLGLAICYSIVTNHGGTIGVASDGKTGSTFWFRIPRAEHEGEKAQ